MLARGQDGTRRPGQDARETVPQATVVVRKQPYGSDEVEITLLDPTYPQALLQEQSIAVGVETGSPARGLQVYTTNLGGKAGMFPKATFATNGLSDPATGAFALTPIVRALAGAPQPYTLVGLSISFVGVAPARETLRSFDSDAVSVAAQILADPGMMGIEYRVKLRTQDKSKISIPEKVISGPVPVPKKPPSRTISPLALVLVAIASAALSALVYFAIRRQKHHAPRRDIG